MCRAEIRHCEEKWSRRRRDLDNARRRARNNFRRAEEASAAGDEGAEGKYLDRAYAALEVEEAIGEELDRHADDTREVSAWEARMASLDPSDRAQALRGSGLNASVGNTEAQYVLCDGGFDPSKAEPARDAGDYSTSVGNKPVGGTWTSPATEDEGDSFASEWARITPLSPDGIYTEIKGGPSAVIVTISNEKEMENLARQFPSGNPRCPVSFSSARDCGIDAIRVRDDGSGQLRDTGGPLSGWDVASTVWLRQDNMEVGTNISPGASRCPSCGQWMEGHHACPTSGKGSGAAPTTTSTGGRRTITHGRMARQPLCRRGRGVG